MCTILLRATLHYTLESCHGEQRAELRPEPRGAGEDRAEVRRGSGAAAGGLDRGSVRRKHGEAAARQGELPEVADGWNSEWLQYRRLK